MGQAHRVALVQEPRVLRAEGLRRLGEVGGQGGVGGREEVHGEQRRDLLLGLASLPGIWLGSHASAKVPDRFLRPILAGMLVLIGGKLIAL